LRVPPAIAFDLAVLHQAARLGATEAKVKDSDSGRIYVAPFRLIWEKGRELDRGHGRQQYLPLSFWLVEGESLQLSLFAEVVA